MAGQKIGLPGEEVPLQSGPLAALGSLGAPQFCPVCG